MYRETIGYIGIDTTDYDKVEALVDEFQLSNMDCHESEILTDVELKFINRLVLEGLLTKEEASELLEHCDVIKFYT
tara:strand:+ start:5248 stop:5475 length:228 start_codon:yes stop_codon:yes gene_type:complete